MSLMPPLVPACRLFLLLLFLSIPILTLAVPTMSATGTIPNAFSFSFSQASSTTATRIDIVQDPASPLLSGKPYNYHIHVNPVPASGDCTQTGGHYDPGKINKGKDYKCNPSLMAATCEMGDLSGKFGGILKSDATKSVVVEGLTVDEAIGKSIVVHNLDGAKWLCANIV